MYTLRMKEWFHYVHMPSTHDMSLKFGRIVHDERFWPIVVAIGLIAVFIALVIWAGLYGRTGPGEIPMYPFSPYGF